MNTRLGKSFGLAFVVAVGILALMFALGTFNAQKVGAQAVAVGSITIDSATPAPGAAVQVRVTAEFTDAVDNFGEFTIELEGYGLPASIDVKDVLIRTGKSADKFEEAGNPSNVTVSGDVITIELEGNGGDGTDDPGIEIDAKEFAQITIRQRAGVTAPALAGNYDVSVGDQTNEDAVTVSPSLSLDPTKGGSGTEITVSGKAFADGTGSLWTEPWVKITDTIFKGVDGNFPDDKGSNDWGVNTDADAEAEYYLLLVKAELEEDGKPAYYAARKIGAAANADPEDLGYVITLASGPEPKEGTPTIPDGTYDSKKAEFLKDVTVDDGAFSTTILASDLMTGDDDGIRRIRMADADGDMNREVFQLTGTMAVASDSANKGTRVTIELSDWIDDDPRAVRIGGELIPTGDVKHLADDDEEEDGFPTNVKAAGQATIYAKVTETVGLGSKTVVLFRNALGTDRIDGTSIEITANALNLTPTTVVPGQEVTITGSGFSGDEGSVASGDITIDGNVAMDIEVSVTSGGQAAGTFVVPAADPGSVTVEMNYNGKTGQAQLTVLEPTITLDPETSRQNTVVQVSGTGFVAASPVTITYDGQTAGSSMTDSVGSWSTQIRVPNNDSFINNTQDVKAESDKTGFDAVSDTVEHSVPNASLDLSHDTVNSGDTVTISGEGFPRFANVKVGFDTNPETTIGRTDGEGDFTATAVVPGMDPGTYLLRVKVDGNPDDVDTSVLFNVTATPISTTQASADAFADLVTANNLIVVWHFDNTTKDWSFYDPRPAVAGAVDLKMVSTGDNVWVRITADQMFQGEALTAGWNLVTLD